MEFLPGFRKMKAFVLLSGGMDSTISLFWALNKGWDISTISISYHQRHNLELASAIKIAQIAHVPHTIIPLNSLSFIGDSALLSNSQIDAPHKSNPNLPASFVPGRNGIFFFLAAAFAYKKGVSNIISGVCQTDFSGYPDCRNNSVKATELAISLCMEKDFTIYTPLMFLTKAESLHLVKSFDLPFTNSCWKALSFSTTCYKGRVPPCGICPSCLLREKGFREAGITDPLLERFK
uniref:7-cyano-7-deazaguanine synthase n=1 Tax=viral metagenome TaxID=1070528 RepID=A0A6M3IUN7_9ZZZZ